MKSHLILRQQSSLTNSPRHWDILWRDPASLIQGTLFFQPWDMSSGKRVSLLTTGLWTSQNALSWLSRIFLSILSLFLSTLSKWQQWRVSKTNWTTSTQKATPEQISPQTHNDSLCLCFCLHENELPLPGKCSLQPGKALLKKHRTAEYILVFLSEFLKCYICPESESSVLPEFSNHRPHGARRASNSLCS